MLRLTKQKKQMYDQLYKITSFFDAQEFHHQILKSDLHLGIATVYRFLNDLENRGEIHSYLCENRKIYSQNKNNHIHFICERCGEKKHLPLKNVHFLKEITNEEICHFQIDVTGICSECKKRI
ncbi:transcriptional repressor [Candidatus Woesearchaeota archaeon]|nr:transcriptional repressor [Candidatus Woesearchaeota archaeon]